MKTVADPAKKQATKPASITDEQERYRAYLDHVRDDAAHAFKMIREDGVIKSSDAELIALNEGFDPDKHRLSDYRAALIAKIARYEASGVTRIGARNAERGAPIKSEKTSGHSWRWTTRDLRVVWLLDASGARKLGFEARDNDRPQRPQVTREGLLGSRHLEDAQPHERPHDRSPADSIHYELVPNEFLEEAIARHLAVWGVPPTDARVSYFPQPTIPTMQLQDVP